MRLEAFDLHTQGSRNSQHLGEGENEGSWDYGAEDAHLDALEHADRIAEPIGNAGTTTETHVEREPYSPSSRVRNCASARFMRVRTVSTGSLDRAAISAGVSPSKNRSTIT